jgi:uncharacterized protein YbaP (TraB family)
MTRRLERCRLKEAARGLVCVVCLLLLSPPVPALECTRWSDAAAGEVDSAFADSFLWQVVSPEGKVNHLFGTIHLDAAQVAQPSPLLVALLRDSRALWLEVALDASSVNALPALMTLPPGEELESLIGRELFAHATRLLDAYGIDPAAANRLEPWAVYTTLNLPADMRGMPLDMALDRLARKHAKPVHGLETFAEQTAIFSAISRPDLLDLLEHTLCHHDRLQAETREVVTLYRAGDLKALLAVSTHEAGEAETRLNQRLVAARNRTMAQRLLGPLRQGGQLVAIGALHLPGEDGVLALLAREGFVLRPMRDR